MEAAGVEPHAEIAGVSFLADALQGTPGGREHVTVGWGSTPTVVTDRWWFNCKADGSGVLLYDLETNDPFANSVADAFPDIVNELFARAKEDGAKVHIGYDPTEAVKDADVVYTDVWASMGQEEEAKKRRDAMKHLQVNQKLLEAAKSDAIVMHCLPAHRGEEITDEVMDGPQSVVVDEAENRMHIQRAIILELLLK